ncbi:ww domain binding 11 protein [Rutstroemia sp. NJR-2017a WRK4]|nr:ww domain binding 11 protein [Rutstroemia sp. NJR-2017a WRK4]
MPKEKSINPAQAARKAEKAKAIKKGKATLQAQKTERLAKKNPFHLQKQLDELKAVEESGGKLTAHEKKLVEGLEKEIKAVRKAREEKGVVDEPRGAAGGRGGRGGFGGGRGGAGVLGKRRRDGDTDESESDEVDEETKRIPMPRDTPPPIPKEVLDKWYAKRRERWQKRNANANETPLGGNDRGSFGGNNGGMGAERPKMEVKTVYEAKPVIRDLRKEATAFVPAVVRQKMQRGKGEGGLMEEDELERLEREGYVKGMGGGSGEGKSEMDRVEGGGEEMEGIEQRGAGVGDMNVEMEEVEDEDA